MIDLSNSNIVLKASVTRSDFFLLQQFLFNLLFDTILTYKMHLIKQSNKTLNKTMIATEDVIKMDLFKLQL